MISDFNPNKARSDGLQTLCKACDSARAKVAYEAKIQRTGLTCKQCFKALPVGEFERTTTGYRRRICNDCRQVRRNEIRRANKGGVTTTRDRKNRHKRNLANTVLRDCRSSDKKKHRDNNLTLEFVRECLSGPCVYCGETKIRMSLDRIDNAKGHSTDNVNPSCLRCNLIRGGMPYAAWLCVLPGVREAREKGLFMSWAGRLGLVDRR